MATLTKTEAKSLELVAKLTAHPDAAMAFNHVSTVKVIGWTLSRTIDSRRRFTDAQRATLYARDNGRCFYCGDAAGSDWQADHVLPHSRGGQTVLENGVVACAACNNAKSDKVW